MSGSSADELEAVQNSAIVLLYRKAEVSESKPVLPFKPQSKDPLFARNDHSFAQIDPDTCEDLEAVTAELMSEIDE